MGDLMGSIVFILVILVIVRRVKLNNDKAGTKRPVLNQPPRQPVAAPSKVTYERPANKPANPTRTNTASSMASSTSGMMKDSSKRLTGMEDRQHDWLARQLAEERVAYRRMSDMFELKRSHEASCDARSIQMEHEEHCDADGIDNAERY